VPTFHCVVLDLHLERSCTQLKNFTFLFNVTPGVRCYPFLRYINISFKQCYGSALVSMRIRIQHFMSLRIRIQGFITKNFSILLKNKIKIKKAGIFGHWYLFLGLHEGRLRYRRNLQPSKENM
jgi:hypothetical protein